LRRKKKKKEKQTNLAIEVEQRKSTTTKQQNREEDGETRKVKMSRFHYSKSVVFPEFYCGTQVVSPSIQHGSHGLYAPFGPRKAYHLGIRGGIPKVMCPT
jgi:hypothetical protein